MRFPRALAGVLDARFDPRIQKDQARTPREKRVEQVGVAALYDPAVIRVCEVRDVSRTIRDGAAPRGWRQLPGERVEIEVRHPAQAGEPRCKRGFAGAGIAEEEVSGHASPAASYADRSPATVAQR